MVHFAAILVNALLLSLILLSVAGAAWLLTLSAVSGLRKEKVHKLLRLIPVRVARQRRVQRPPIESDSDMPLPAPRRLRDPQPRDDSHDA